MTTKVFPITRRGDAAPFYPWIGRHCTFGTVVVRFIKPQTGYALHRVTVGCETYGPDILTTDWREWEFYYDDD